MSSNNTEKGKRDLNIPYSSFIISFHASHFPVRKVYNLYGLNKCDCECVDSLVNTCCLTYYWIHNKILKGISLKKSGTYTIIMKLIEMNTF